MSLRLYQNRPPHADRMISTTVREQSQWEEILKALTPQEAAARIFGDLMCYTATRKQNGHDGPREQFYSDVEQLARALQAYANQFRPPVIVVTPEQFDAMAEIFDTSEMPSPITVKKLNLVE